MKKLLLLILTVCLSINLTKAQASDPVFPSSFGVDLSVEGLEVTQTVDQDVYTIAIEGECAADQFTVTLAVPDGWDGFVGMTDVDYNPDYEPMKSRAAESEWVPVEALLEFGMKTGNSFTFPVDNDAHYAQLYLYKGDMADEANQVVVEIYVEKKEGSADPVFPASFGVDLSVEGLEVTQTVDQDVYTIVVEGECAEEEFTVTLAVPDGWDGFVGMTDVDYNPDYEPMKSRAAESEWVPVEALLEFGMKTGNSFTFPVDNDAHYAQLYLYKGDMADEANQVVVEIYVEKKEGSADPVFPESFDITVDSETVTVTQGIDEDNEQYTIMVNGTTTADNVTLSFNLPEGWDGLIGGVMDFGGMMVKSRSEFWPTIEEYAAELPGYGIQDVMQGKELVFSAGEGLMGLFCLYADGKVDVEHGIMVVVDVVKSGQSGIGSIEVDGAASRYFNLQGVEVDAPENGVFIKITDGKASKVLVK